MRRACRDRRRKAGGSRRRRPGAGALSLRWPVARSAPDHPDLLLAGSPALATPQALAFCAIRSRPANSQARTVTAVLNPYSAAHPPGRGFGGAGEPELVKAGGFRLDDPQGAVGIEFMVVTDTSGTHPPKLTKTVPGVYRITPPTAMNTAPMILGRSPIETPSPQRGGAV
ncbi:MAG TPA: hypothetical protein VM347_39540 [Nonomuraea sp.]|nr:hypothetical protein [Nonomuraea sp.]